MNRSSIRGLRTLALLALALTPAVRVAAADPPQAPLHSSPAPPPEATPAAPPAPTAGAPVAPVAPAAAAAPAAPREIVLGRPDRAQMEAAVPDWVQVEAGSAVDAKTAQALAAVAPGATLTIYLGSWCGDSRREVSRFWHALDAVGRPLPFPVTYIAVDPGKQEPAALLQGVDLRYVPTFVVTREGREVGRIVESAPHGIEKDLLALLDGSAHGLLTDRADLRDAKPQP
jgi:hypothetical protein